MRPLQVRVQPAPQVTAKNLQHLPRPGDPEYPWTAAQHDVIVQAPAAVSIDIKKGQSDQGNNLETAGSKQPLLPQGSCAIWESEASSNTPYEKVSMLGFKQGSHCSPSTLLK